MNHANDFKNIIEALWINFMWSLTWTPTFSLLLFPLRPIIHIIHFIKLTINRLLHIFTSTIFPRKAIKNSMMKNYIFLFYDAIRLYYHNFRQVCFIAQLWRDLEELPFSGIEINHNREERTFNPILNQFFGVFSSFFLLFARISFFSSQENLFKKIDTLKANHEISCYFQLIFVCIHNFKHFCMTHVNSQYLVYVTRQHPFIFILFFSALRKLFNKKSNLSMTLTENGNKRLGDMHCTFITCQ